MFAPFCEKLRGRGHLEEEEEEELAEFFSEALLRRGDLEELFVEKLLEKTDLEDEDLVKLSFLDIFHFSSM